MTTPRRRARTLTRVASLAVVCTVSSLGGVALLSSGASAASLPLTLTPATAAARVPGTAVAAIPAMDVSANGGTNAIVGTTAKTKVLGQQDAGVVPVVGQVGAVADDGAYVAYETVIDARTVDLMISSPGLLGGTSVRLYLPAGYSSNPTQTWPTLYLLGGSSEKTNYQAWSLYSNALSFLSAQKAIIAMPAGGATGLGSNWSNGGVGAKGGNQWDTYLATELPQLLQRGYRASTKQAVAGVSTGGYTAMELAALHPGAYSAAASYSGLDSLSISIPWVQTILAREGVSIFQPWGSYLLNNAYWQAWDPADHLSGLRNTKVFLSAGNGVSGPLDPKSLLSFLSIDPLEAVVGTNSATFNLQLALNGVRATTDFYGSGTHSWPYWSRELQRSWPVLAAGLGLA